MGLAQNVSANQYEGNDSATIWDYTFKIWDTSDIEVWLTDEEGLDTQVTSNFEVNDSGGVGGTVEYPLVGAPLPAGNYITIKRETPYTQEFIDISSGQPFNPVVVETAFDKTVAQVQQHDRVLTKCIKVGETQVPSEDYLGDCQEAAEEAEEAATEADFFAEEAEFYAEEAEEYAEEAAEGSAAEAKHWAEEAEEYAEEAEEYAEEAASHVNDLVVNTHEETAVGGETYVSTPFVLAASLDNIFCFINGEKRLKSDLIRLTDNRLGLGFNQPLDSSFGISFIKGESADWAGGNDNGSLIDGAYIEDDILKFPTSAYAYALWEGEDNTLSDLTGAIRVKVIPNYNGSPSYTQDFFAMSAAGTINSEVNIRHTTEGKFKLEFADESAVSYVYYSSSVWSPVSGTEYEIELNYNLSTQNLYLFVDGTLFYSVAMDSFSRSHNDIDRIYLGRTRLSLNSHYHFVKELILFDDVQHTSNYTPSSPYHELSPGDVVEIRSVAFSPTAVGDAVAAAGEALAS